MVRSSEPLNKPIANRQAEIKPLLREWWLYLAISVVMFVAGYFLLRAGWNPVYALRWALTASLIMIYVLVMVRRALPLNHRPNDTTLLPTLGAANWLSLLRGLLLALIGGFLLSPRPPDWLSWTLAALNLIMMALDLTDGFVARATNHMTALGGHLDGEMDALTILIVPLLAVLYGQITPLYLLVSVARYLFVGGLWLLKRQGKPMYDLTPSHLRRYMAGYQMGMLSFMLAPLFSPPGTSIVAMIFASPLLAGFVRDWLVVSGAANPASERYSATMYRSEIIFRQWLPVLLRVYVTIWALVTAFGVIMSGAQNPLIGIAMIICTIMVALGIVPRMFAGLILLLIGLFLPMQPASTIVVIASCAALLVLGSGKWSLWTPEEIPMHRRYGGKAD